MRAPPRKVLIAAQFVAAALVLFFIGRELARQWTAFRAQPLEAHVRWWDIAAASALVLLTYALLVHTWRVMLRGWGTGGGASLSFRGAARIWSVSNLARYVPGKIWQIPVMAEMARREGVSPVAATGSALLNTVMNIAAGVAISLVLGWRWLDQIRSQARAVAIVLVVLAAIGLVLLPFMLPRIAAIVARLTGRNVELGTPSAKTLITAAAGNVVAWLLYGVAFMVLVRGVLGHAPSAVPQYIAVFTASYVVGYLFLFVPGGIGPREWVMVTLLTSLQLTTYKQGLLVAGASRVWLTVLEILPGLLFVAHDAAQRRSTPQNPTDGSTE